MVRSIADAAAKVKADVAAVLSGEMILEACREAGLSFRKRVLDPVATIHLFLLQILHGNTACTHVVHWAGKRVSAAAYCRARQRLPSTLLQTLLSRVVEALRGADPAARTWLGHRVFFVDATGCSMPDTPELQAHFGQPSQQSKGCGFPAAMLMMLIDWARGGVDEVLIMPLRGHEMRHASKLHPRLEEEDVVVGDRAYCSFAHLALLKQRGVHGVFRMHQRMIVDFRPGRAYAAGKQRGRPRSRWLKRVGAVDQWCEWRRPKQRARWMTAEEHSQLPETLTVRELRYRVRPRGFRTQHVVLATTLLEGDSYSAEALAELYGARWRMETDFRHLKQTMGMDVLKCKDVEGVTREILAFCLVYNLLRMLMAESARRQSVDVDRISFVDALRWLLEARPLEEISLLLINPLRPHRIEPRVRKRRPKEFPVMKAPRDILRKRLRARRLKA
jgi:hypothetical protein